jgi:signal transduction histidine kinase
MEQNADLLRAVHLASRKLSGTGTFDSLLKEVLRICVEAVGAEGGTIYLHDPVRKRLRFRHVLPDEVADRLPFEDLAEDQGIAGKSFISRETTISQFEQDEDETRNRVKQATGVAVRNMITVPLLIEEMDPIGVVQLVNKKDGPFNEDDQAVLDTISAVATMAYLNHRLMDETQRASSLLGMGKVSHDIGNLAAALFANISFSELALDGMKDEFAENDTALMYVESLDSMLDELKSSVDRIVGYSRLISDLSVGRELRPNFVVAPLAQTIQTAAAFLESDGRKASVALRYDIDTDSPATAHDELYLFRIVQNLVGNAIKAVKETVPDDWKDHLPEEGDAIYGEVIIHYCFRDNQHIIEVEDTGPGMSPETAEKILAGNARSQWDKGSGSGWGTKIVLELAATHQGQISIDSEIGKGTIFRLALQHQPELPA